ncbi:MAG: hypothetical protein JNJ88_18850 [Planctomycetes bacterium]|nr:hypothetical protein [Planctomycetota bacterium]
MTSPRHDRAPPGADLRKILVLREHLRVLERQLKLAGDRLLGDPLEDDLARRRPPQAIGTVGRLLPELLRSRPRRTAVSRHPAGVLVESLELWERLLKTPRTAQHADRRIMSIRQLLLDNCQGTRSLAHLAARGKSATQSEREDFSRDREGPPKT